MKFSAVILPAQLWMKTVWQHLPMSPKSELLKLLENQKWRQKFWGLKLQLQKTCVNTSNWKPLSSKQQVFTGVSLPSVISWLALQRGCKIKIQMNMMHLFNLFSFMWSYDSRGLSHHVNKKQVRSQRKTEKGPKDRTCWLPSSICCRLRLSSLSLSLTEHIHQVK